LKKKCYDRGIVTRGKYLDIVKFREAFRDGHLDVEIFRQALK